ncbi:MAG: glycosyltransferase family 1 protein [Maribacter sp.]
MFTKNSSEIIVNARFLTQPITGVQRFAVELCRRLPKKIGNTSIIFVAPKNVILNNTDDFPEITTFGTFKGQLWEQIDLPLFLKNKGNPLLVNLVGIGPILYRNKIMALYDLAFKHFPEWFSYSFQKVYNTFIPISLKNSRIIITDSNYVKKDICSTYKTEKEKVEVIYAAPSQIFTFDNLEREKFILTVSSIDPRKNLVRIIKAFNLLKTNHKLIIVGSKNKTFKGLKLDENLLSDKIIFTGYLDDNELISLYNRAAIFIYASLFEGFGIPPLEAQACGCPCIVSRSTALPEIYSNSVEYCDPYSIEDISERLHNVLNCDTLKSDLQTKGLVNVKRYDWDKSAKQLLKLLEI